MNIEIGTLCLHQESLAQNLLIILVFDKILQDSIFPYNDWTLDVFWLKSCAFYKHSSFLRFSTVFVIKEKLINIILQTDNKSVLMQLIYVCHLDKPGNYKSSYA